jgi:hypothetical protein
MPCIGSSEYLYYLKAATTLYNHLTGHSLISPEFINPVLVIVKMCHYMDLPFYYNNYRAQLHHISVRRRWDECPKAQENGHYCSDASPAKDLGGNVYNCDRFI